MKGKETWIAKTYPPNKELSKEEQLEYSSQQLADDVIKICMDVMKKVREKIADGIELKMYKESFPVLLKFLAKKNNTGTDKTKE